MITWLVIGGIVVLAYWQRRNLARVAVAISAQFGKGARAVWKADPAAIYQNEIDRGTEAINSHVASLANYKTELYRLQRKVDGETKEVNRLTAKVKEKLVAKDEGKAAEYALELKTWQNELTQDQTELDTYKQGFDNEMKKVKYEKDKIEKASENGKRLNAQLKMEKARAAVSNFDQRFSVKSTMEGLGEVEEEMRSQIDAYRAKGEVAVAMSSSGLEEIQEEENTRKAEAAELLDKFKSEMKQNK